MAGFFGFFDYSKAGPGIEKDAPQKKTVFVFLETFFRNFWKFIPINLIFSVIGILGFTKGIASVGLTNVARNIARDKHSFGVSDFFDTIKLNFKQSLLAGIINTFIYAILIVDVLFFYNFASSKIKYIGIAVLGLVMLMFTFMTYYMWTLIITFDFKLSAVYKNSYKFVFLNLKNNFICFIAMLLLYGIIAVVVWSFRTNALVFFAAVIVLATCVPAYKYLMVQYAVFPSIKKYIIDPYYEAHPDEDIEKRRNLGLEVNQEEETEE